METVRGRSESRKEAPAERRETGSSPGSEVRKNEVTIPSPLQLHPNTPSCSTSSPSTPIIIPGWGIPGESNSCLATELMFDCRLMQKIENTKIQGKSLVTFVLSDATKEDRPVLMAIVPHPIAFPCLSHRHEAIRLSTRLFTTPVRCCYQVLFALLSAQCRQPSNTTDASLEPSM